MADCNVVPAATIILNLPKETPDDCVKTAELIDRLRPYPSLIVPMYLVPMGVLKDKRALLAFKIKPEHVDVMWKCLEHSLYWAPRLASMYLSDRKSAPVRMMISLFLKLIEWKKRSLEKKIREYLEMASEGAYEHKAVEEEEAVAT